MCVIAAGSTDDTGVLPQDGTGDSAVHALQSVRHVNVWRLAVVFAEATVVGGGAVAVIRQVVG